MADFRNFRFYKINIDYLRMLYEADPEVYYDLSYTDKNKPYVGIVVNLAAYDYFIPLTSRKAKHSSMPFSGRGHIMVTEIVKCKLPNGVFKNDEKGRIHSILAMLDIKKMIPVPRGVYSEIVINELDDIHYRNLLAKEYRFCYLKRREILQKAETLYKQYCEDGRKEKFGVNFSFCEKKLEEWQSSRRAGQ